MCAQVEKLDDPITPVTEILARVPAKKLMQIYKIPSFKGADGMLALIAQSRGKLKKGGTVDTTAAARIVLSDWNDGRIPFFTRPPTRENEAHDRAELVAGYAADFDAASVYANEASAVVEGLPGMDKGTYVEAKAGVAATVRACSIVDVFCGSCVKHGVCLACMGATDAGRDAMQWGLCRSWDACTNVL